MKKFNFKNYFTSKKLIVILLILSFALRAYRLDYPKNYVFDEVYHGFTAKEYLKGSKEAWEWWTTPPPGVAYEWTHPPLAKELMAASMLIFKTEDGWAYRLPGVLLGSLSVYLIYLLGVTLFNHKGAALIAAFTFSIDGLNFVQSRTGMNDIYYVTFILASLLFFSNNKLILSAIFFGLALSSKWAAIYLILIYIFVLFKRQNSGKITYFIIIPLIIYLLSYIPFFLLGHNLYQFAQLQTQMWWYHTNLKATHAYSSSFWSWPLNLYPVWYFVDYQKDNVANIFATGNFTVFWVGTASLILTVWELFKKKSINLLLIVMGFFIFWLPWAFSPRIMFLYHFSSSVPFLSLALGYQLGLELEDKKRRRLTFILLLLMVLTFILIFPFLTGLPIPKNFVGIFFLTNLSKNPF